LGGDTWLAWLFGRQNTVPQPSFSGFYAPSSYLIVLLEVFTIVLFACAVAAEYVGIIFERLNAQSVMARTEAERGQELWASLIERLPLPALLIDPATLRVVASSEFAVTYLGGGEMPLEGRNLFEALRFSYPDTVHELIVGSDGAAPWTVIRVADQLRVVVDARGRIQAFNKRAEWLFGGVEAGADAAQLLPPDAGSRWWDPGLNERRKMHVEIGPRLYQVTSSAIALSGEEERIFTVSFLPVAKGGTADPFGTSSTIVTKTLEQLR
jgi:hypothetical protein